MKHRSACLDPGGALNWVVYYLLHILNRDLYLFTYTHYYGYHGIGFLGDVPLIFVLFICIFRNGLIWGLNPESHPLL